MDDTTQRVLIVEHDAALRESICATLDLDRYTYETANDGMSAIEQAGAFSFKLIVADLGAPHVAQRQVCWTLRQQALNRRTPIIVIAPVNGWLLSQIWGSDRFVTVRSVDTLVSRLRRRIEPDTGDNPRYIQTVRGIGYKLGDV